ncbi:MAG: glycoside hydrolase family 9 protein [Terriglobales bacterium]
MIRDLLLKTFELCKACLPGSLVLSLLLSGLGQPLLAQQDYPRKPLQAKLEDGAEYRWLKKKVLDSRVLDSMESLSSWSFKGEGDMTLSDAYKRDGQHSLRIQSTFSLAHVDGAGEWEDLIATRTFPSEDWRKYNRISLWVYADVAGAPALAASLTLHNEGEHLLPDPYNEGRDESLLLNNHAWTHLVWEIAPLDRDKVTALDFAYSLPKMFPDPGDHTVLYIDQLELQTVVPDHVEGWDVAAGKIAFSHGGYTAGSSKSAIASDLTAPTFSVIEQSTGRVVLTRPVEKRKTSLGGYQVLDFSDLQKPGRYQIRAGNELTRPFVIGDDAWNDSVWKALNFMYSERCGTVIPGIHGVCHQDDYTVHGDKRIVINGGYHDAGDLTATGNVTGMAYALFSYAERLQQQKEDPELRVRLLEEAKWGLAWILKTSFGEGYRSTGQLISYWTDGIMGDADDRSGQAVNNPEWNFRVAAVEALAARALKDSDPELANRSLATAKEDWKFAVEGLKNAPPLAEVYGAQDELERISFGATASADLFRATGDQQYADEAVMLGNLILQSQERKLQSWTAPLTGYFYTSPKRENLFHRFHIGQEEQPIVALAHLCEAFPDNQDWIKWYSAIVLHSKYYQQAVAPLDAPYDVLPAAVYRESEVRLIPETEKWRPLRAADRNSYLEQVRRGVPLGGDYYLRRFPVWFNFRGNSSVLLSEAKALSVAAQVRGDLGADDLAQKQAQWFVGRNPFSASLMYGEGYDWTPLYSVRSGQMVGALPVGIETKSDNDAPYWPMQICWTYKEVWTQPVGEWIWLMQDLNGSAVVRGIADKDNRELVEFRNQRTGFLKTVRPDPGEGAFRVLLPQGSYAVRQGVTQTTLTALSGGSYDIELRREKALDFKVTAETEKSGDIVLRVTARGAGRHVFSIRADNLEMRDKEPKTVEPSSQNVAEAIWHAHIVSPETPWVAVVIPDNALNRRREITGTARPQGASEGQVQ